MFYKLTEQQAILLAEHFQYLKGQPLGQRSELPIEEIYPLDMQDGTWQVYLKTYLGDKEAFYENAGDKYVITNLWHYITTNNVDFNAEDIGLILQ